MAREVRAVGAALTDGVAGAGRLDTLEEILRAGYHVVEIVVQDEYTHDVITTPAAARLGAAGAPSFVVFDTT